MASYVDESFDAGNTKYSDYFPEGAENYQENLLRYADPQGNIKSRDIASSSHWGRDDDSTIYHWRQGDYDLADAGQFGGRARYIGEIQSDPQQNLDGDVPAPYDYLANKGNAKEILQQARDAFLSKQREADENFTNLRQEFNLWGQKNPSALNDLKNDFLVKEYNFEQQLGGGFFNIPDDGTVPKLPLDASTWTDEQNNAFLDWYRDNIGRYDLGVQLPRHAMRNPNLLGDKWEADVIRGLANKQSDFDAVIGDLEKEVVAAEQLVFKPQSVDYVEGGPFMSSQNKWLDNALRRSIVDAVNDPDVNYLTFPFSEEAIGKVGGNAFSPKQGTIDYYQRDTQNRLKKILRGIDPSVEMENVELRGTDSGEIGDFMSRGFRLTPQFRDKVRESGLPAWMIAGGVGLSGLMEYLQQKREEQKYGPRRSLLEL
jgi:hypothetical protein